MNTYKIKLILIPLFLHFMACSDDSGNSEPSPPAEESTAPTNEYITALIQAGDYKTWFGNATVQTAQAGSPHGKVRTFLNTELKASVDAGQSEHTVGSISIKELYDSAGSTITGYAYSQKIAAGTGANTWYWYEDLDPSTTSVDYSGIGLTGCANCHSSGQDYLRIQF